MKEIPPFSLIFQIYFCYISKNIAIFVSELIIHITMSYANIIGREKEIATLERLYQSQKSEFVAIYGRRRVGKSYLVNEMFSQKITFKAVGTYVKDGHKDYTTYRKLQLSHFYDSLILSGLSTKEPKPNNWREAFLLLRKMLQAKSARRKILFFDELPWLAGPQSSEMVAELGYFWNSWADSERNILLIVCGSATSWMLDNVIHDYGGLHGRLTANIRLEPFTLGECEKYYRKHKFQLSRYEMCVSYMAFGGVPYYLDKLQNNLTVTENIDRIFFADEMIHQEFRDVYAGLYSSQDRYIDIVKALGQHSNGLTQTEICNQLKMSSGGSLSKLLDNLRESGIIQEFPRYGKSRVEKVHRLVDFFSLFYLHFRNIKPSFAGGWTSIQGTSTFYSWAGTTFELLCMAHLSQISNQLRIPSINRAYSWRGNSPDGKGAQIDCVIESKTARTDYVCEMKFATHTYAISAIEANHLQHRVQAFIHSKMHTPSHSAQVVLITTMGIAQGVHSSLVHHVITLNDLFL